MDDNRKTVALAIAKDLDGELGGGVLAAMQSDKKTRTLGFSEAAAAAGLIMSAVQIAMQCLSDKKMATLQDQLEASLGRPVRLSPEKRATIMRSVLKQFVGSPQKTS